MPRRRVAFLQAWIYQYREPFYEGLRVALDRRGIALQLVHGAPSGGVAHTRDTIDIPWATKITNRRLHVAGKELWWQPALRLLHGADLVVVEQASSRLVNYALLALQAAGRTKVAFWGHGRDFRPGRFAGVGEGVKRVVSRRPHWWFAYNSLVADIVAGLGYPRERITDVQNAIDTSTLAAAVAALTPDDLARARREAGVGEGPVLLFCGAMYPDKRLDWIVAAAEHMRRTVGDVQLVLVGDGVSADVARAAAATHPWVHWLGQRFGDRRAPWFAMARALLLPGAVGLAVQDSFAAGVPTIASHSGKHGPEIAYLEDGRNSLVVDDAGDPATYAAAVVTVLRDDAVHRRLCDGAAADRDRFTIEQMVDRFATGIDRALATPRRRGL